jgi:cell division protein FtsZ
MTLFEADEAATRIREEVDPDANIIFGATFNAALEGKMRVSVVATGIDMLSSSEARPNTDTGNRFYGGKPGFNPPAKAIEPVRAPAIATARPADVKIAPRPVTELKPVVKTTAAPQSATAQTRPQAAATPLQPSAPVAASEPSVAFCRNIRTSVGAASNFQDALQPKAQPASKQKHQEPSFVSPQPAQPAQRTFFAAQDDAQHFGRKDTSAKTKVSPREHASGTAQERPQPAAGSTMSFFQRMAGVGRVLTSRHEQPERNLHVVEKAKVEVTERSVKPAMEDDYLEIPAFLRRQAN